MKKKKIEKELKKYKRLYAEALDDHLNEINILINVVYDHAEDHDDAALIEGVNQFLSAWNYEQVM